MGVKVDTDNTIVKGGIKPEAIAEEIMDDDDEQEDEEEEEEDEEDVRNEGVINKGGNEEQ